MSGLTADVAINTAEGWLRVEQLAHCQFEAIIDGKPFYSTPHGFFPNGDAAVYGVYGGGMRLMCGTLEHPLLTIGDADELAWLRINDLRAGQRLVLHREIDVPYAVQRHPATGRMFVLCDGVEAVGVRDVYDCTIPGVNVFDANGLYVASGWLQP